MQVLSNGPMTTWRHAITRMYRAAREIAASPLETCENVIRTLRHELDYNAVDLDRREKIDDAAFERANAFFRNDPKLGRIYLVKPSYIQKLCGIELSSRDVATALEKLRVLLPESAAIPTRQVMIGADRPRMRYYCIRASFVSRIVCAPALAGWSARVEAKWRERRRNGVESACSSLHPAAGEARGRHSAAARYISRRNGTGSGAEKVETSIPMRRERVGPRSPVPFGKSFLVWHYRSESCAI